MLAQFPVEQSGGVPLMTVVPALYTEMKANTANTEQVAGLKGVVNTAEDVGDLRPQEEQTAEDYQDDKEHYQGVLEHPLSARPCGA
jgi:hypothetical protein